MSTATPLNKRPRSAFTALFQASRYAAWAAAGAVLCVILIVACAASGGEKIFAPGGDGILIVSLVAAVPATVFVVLRWAVGAFSHVEGRAGDWLTVRGLIYFFLGALAGEGVFFALVGVCSEYVSLRDVGFVERLSWLVFPLLGGLSLVVTAWITRSWSMSWRWAAGAPLWCLMLAIASTVWLAIDGGSCRGLLGVARNEVFIRHEPVSYWLDQLDSSGSDRRTAVDALRDAAKEDPRAMPALRAVFTDADPEVAIAAIAAVQQDVQTLDSETVAALGNTLGDPRPGVQQAAIFALHKATPADLETVIPALCRLYIRSDRGQSSIGDHFHRFRPQIARPDERFSRHCGADDAELARRAAAFAQIVRQLGPPAVAEYRATLGELLISPRPSDRHFASIALAALGSFTLATAQEPKAANGTKQTTNSAGMKLTLVPAGEFKMGSGESAEDIAAFFKKNYGTDFLTADSFKDEHPQHRVRITKPYYLGTYHVTRGQFRQFVKDSGYKTDAEKGDNPGAYGWSPEKKEFRFNKDYSWRNAGFEQTDEHPVVNVSWNDAVEYCKWLSKKEGKTYRLPTEAEWEYACRAGTTTQYYSGDDPETLAKVGNAADAAAKAQFPDWKCTIKANDGYVFTAPVGKFKPNAFGLYDMHGNAWQWCADWYGKDYLESPTDDPTGPSVGSRRVLRGGSWYLVAWSCRSAIRSSLEPEGRHSLLGFRACLVPADK